MASNRSGWLRYDGVRAASSPADLVCELCCFEKSCCYPRHVDAVRHPRLCRMHESMPRGPNRTHARQPGPSGAALGRQGRPVASFTVTPRVASSPPPGAHHTATGRLLAQRAGRFPLPIVLSAVLLLWPALLNGYPIVFDDTGTYLSQAVHHYLGWDRPIFYSLFLLPLHLTITTWPAIAVQALLAASTLHLVWRVLLPAISPWWLVLFAAALAATTALPWFTSQLMPDIFTPLLILVLALLLFNPERLSRSERIGLVLFAAFMIATQQSSVALSLGLLLALTPFRGLLGASGPLGCSGWTQLAAPPLLAMAALVAVNLAGHGRAALSPYGNMFILARVIYDGPGMDVLRRDCPDAGWRLCPYLDRFPATSDQFLWRPDSPVMLAGGHKRVSAEASAIIAAALRAEPGTELLAWLHNGATQLGDFATGDELHACPITVTPWIARDFPAREHAAYAAARQTGNRLVVPAWMQTLDTVVALSGIAGCEIVLVVALRRRHVAAGFAATVLLAVVANAFIAGELSTPHHRYGSRVMLLAPAVAVLGGLALARKPEASVDAYDACRVDTASAA